jgi:outer membrane immunogenic protein
MHRVVIASLAAASLGVGLTAAASAGDLGRPAPAVPYSWTGFYAGLSAGHGWSNGDVDVGTNPIAFDTGVGGSRTIMNASAAAVPPDFNTMPKGSIAGGQLGYNFQSGLFVWGVETDLSWADVKGTATQTGTAPTDVAPFVINAAGTAEQKMDAFGTLRARLGFTPVDKLLVFGTGGLAYGHIESNTNLSAVISPTIAGVVFADAVDSASAWHAGWTLGGGLEYAFAARWTAKAEYLHYDLGTLSYNTTLLGSTTPSAFPPISVVGVASSAEFKGHIVRAGINYNFN